jgi:hypothetical protein
MGGVFAVVKVRKNLTNYDDPGWYENPPGTRRGSHLRGNAPRLTTDSECLRGFAAKYRRERAGNSHSSCMWNGGEHRFRTIYRLGNQKIFFCSENYPTDFLSQQAGPKDQASHPSYDGSRNEARVYL